MRIIPASTASLFDKSPNHARAIPIGSTATNYTIPGSVTNIGSWAFAYSPNLTAITIPATVTGIGSGAFYDCSALRSIVIPGGVKKIPDHAFSYCTNLVNLTIPSSVTNVGTYAFGNCSGIVRFLFCRECPALGVDVFYNNTKPPFIVCRARRGGVRLSEVVRSCYGTR